MSDQDVSRSSIPSVWHERIRNGLKPESNHFPQGLFVSEIQYNVPLQWRVISITEGSHFGAPPGIYIETNFTEQVYDANPNLSLHQMGSILAMLLRSETKDVQSIPVPDYVKALHSISKSARISLGNGVKFRPYAKTPMNTIILEVMAPSLVESMNVIRSLESKAPAKFHFMDLFRKK